MGAQLEPHLILPSHSVNYRTRERTPNVNCNSPPKLLPRLIGFVQNWYRPVMVLREFFGLSERWLSFFLSLRRVTMAISRVHSPIAK